LIQVINYLKLIQEISIHLILAKFYFQCRREVQMVQSHYPPSPEIARDKRYYEHVMKDFHKQYDSVRQTSQYRHNRMNTPTFTIISCTQTSALSITTRTAHKYQTQTVAGVSKVVLPVKNEHKHINLRIN
jgi:hypothetical protein